MLESHIGVLDNAGNSENAQFSRFTFGLGKVKEMAGTRGIFMQAEYHVAARVISSHFKIRFGTVDGTIVQELQVLFKILLQKHLASIPESILFIHLILMQVCTAHMGTANNVVSQLLLYSSSCGYYL